MHIILVLSKSATEAANNETYGIIPYVAPRGRRLFWDRSHDTELFIDICDGLRPLTGDINAPKGYIELMKGYCDSDPIKRPEAGGMIHMIEREEVPIGVTKVVVTQMIDIFKILFVDKLGKPLLTNEKLEFTLRSVHRLLLRYFNEL
ncbi:4733_t:CDS:2, partial [Funneliformis geosporum]